MIASRVINQICEWVGCVQGDSTHKHILDVYNAYIKAGKAPYASKHLMTVTDAWCAATVSAAIIESGFGDEFGCVECSCGRMIELLKKKGWWIEADNTVPNDTDLWLIFYSWSDDGKGECTKGNDHVGIVIRTVDGKMNIVEGNKGDAHKCGTRTIAVDGRYIRGFGRIPCKNQNTYKVVKGDTLIGIGKKSGVEWRKIAELNNISSPYIIRVGQILRIR